MMSGTQNTTMHPRLARIGLAARLGLVSAILLVTWLLLAPWAYYTAGNLGMAACGAAAGIVWLGAAIALPIASLLAGPATAVFGVTLAMFARAAVPLAAGVTLHFQSPALAQAGLIYYLLVFYMVALATETALLLARIPRTHKSPNAV